MIAFHSQQKDTNFTNVEAVSSAGDKKPDYTVRCFTQKWYLVPTKYTVHSRMIQNSVAQHKKRQLSFFKPVPK